MKINIYNRQKNLLISSPAVKKIVKEVLRLEKASCDEVSCYFVTPKVICQLHDEYFQDPSLTDCISFPMDDTEQIPGLRILGEVFVCPQTAIEYAAKHEEDPYTECTLYIIHGLLHLLGFDDLNTKDKAQMRKAEKKHLLNLKKLNLILKS